jgi:hypothetical protein
MKVPHESLSLLARLLGASSVAKGAGSHECQAIPPISNTVNGETHGETREVILSMLQKEGLKSLLCPALSLKHDREDTSSTDVQSRKQVQGNAAALLAREITSSEEKASEDTSALSKIPETLLGNVYESFAVLVDSRLRAYSNFLALQGVSLARKDPSYAPADLKALEQKVEALLVAGRKVSVDSVSTHFEESRLIEDDDEENTSRVSLPLLFRVQINLIVPRSNGETQKVNVCLTVPGDITGKSSIPLFAALIMPCEVCSDTFSHTKLPYTTYRCLLEFRT